MPNPIEFSLLVNSYPPHDPLPCVVLLPSWRTDAIAEFGASRAFGELEPALEFVATVSAWVSDQRPDEEPEAHGERRGA